jgi:hypothetical protein
MAVLEAEPMSRGALLSSSLVVLVLLVVALPAGAQTAAPLPPLAPIVPGATGGGGGFLGGFVKEMAADTAPWLTNSTTLFRVFFTLFLTLTIVFRLARQVVSDQSVAGLGHFFPRLLLDLLPAWAIVYAAPIFCANLLAIGTGAGTSITGNAIVSPTDMMQAYLSLIGSFLLAPSSVIAHPVANLGDAATAAVLTPGGLGFDGLLVAAFVLSCFVAGVGAVSIFTMVWVQIDALIVGPVALLLVAFIALPQTGLFQVAMSAMFRRIFRLIMLIAITTVVLAELNYFNTWLATVNVLDLGALFYSWFEIVMGVLVAGGLVCKLPMALDTAFGGFIGPNIDLGAQVIRPALRAATKLPLKKAA